MSCAFFVTTSLLPCPSPAHGKNSTGTDGSTQIRSRVLFHTELAEDGETVGRLSLGGHFSRFSFLNPVLALSRWRPQCRHLLIGGTLGSRAAPPAWSLPAIMAHTDPALGFSTQRVAAMILPLRKL